VPELGQFAVAFRIPNVSLPFWQTKFSPAQRLIRNVTAFDVPLRAFHCGAAGLDGIISTPARRPLPVPHNRKLPLGLVLRSLIGFPSCGSILEKEFSTRTLRVGGREPLLLFSAFRWARGKFAVLERGRSMAIERGLNSSGQRIISLDLSMDLRRGLFRLWIVFAVLFASVAAIVSFDGVRDEFRNASVKNAGSHFALLVPVDCLQARGQLDSDYYKNAGYCWYEMPKFRALYPQYKHWEDSELSEELYKKIGIILPERRPWTKLAQAAGLALGIPVAVLLLGWGLLRALSGIRMN
jgi:hypothetical protein